jgi:carboxyl-terminal processing protease
MYLTNIRNNSPAHKTGLLIGDQIFSINSELIENPLDENIFSKIKDEVVEIKVLRQGVVDTLVFAIQKDTLYLSSIPYSSILKNNIGYIRIEQFTNSSFKEFENEFFSLQKIKKLSGLIIDLRGNSGGIMQEALKICNMFVPKGSLILSVQGPTQNDNFFAKVHPIDTILPLVILIDEQSASASEIIAGCFQDLDRAVIIGTPSFGKGLVQEIFQMSKNTFLKLTTAKYYTPSGRCINKNFSEYTKNNNKFNKLNFGIINPQPQIFHTTSGRDVISDSGIIPDHILDADTITNQLVLDIINTNLTFNFANYWTNTRSNSGSNPITIDDSIYQDYIDFILSPTNIKYLPTINTIDSVLVRSNSENTKKILETTINNIAVEYRDNLLEDGCKNDLTRYLDLMINYRILSEKDFIEYTLITDKVSNFAINFLTQKP